MIPLLSVVGKKGSGKTEVLETLIALLSERGFRIGVIKHLARDDFEIDEPGKDTYRYRMQGARKVILAGRKRLAIFANLEKAIPIECLLLNFQDFDLVFLEGYFLGEIPKIEVHRRVLGDSLLTERMSNVVAICSDVETARSVPHFFLNQLEGLATWIEKQILQTRQKVCL